MRLAVFVGVRDATHGLNWSLRRHNAVCTVKDRQNGGDVPISGDPSKIRDDGAGQPAGRLRLWGAVMVRARHPLLVGSLVAMVVAAVGWRYGVAPSKPAASVPVVEAPVRPVERHAPEDAERVIVTLRWGHTTASPTDADRGDAGTAWDGYLALDCGAIERVETLGIEDVAPVTPGLVHEPGRDAPAHDSGDRIGPVVRGDDGDQRVYWRSRTHADWDGVRVTLAICRSDMADGASTLRIVTPQKSYSARLDWSVDDFVSLRASPDGSSLDVHMASTRDRRRVPEARVTQAPPGAAVAPVAEGPLPEPVAVPPGH